MKNEKKGVYLYWDASVWSMPSLVSEWTQISMTHDVGRRPSVPIMAGTSFDRMSYSFAEVMFPHLHSERRARLQTEP